MKIYPHPLPDDESMKVSSASDCTGLIPAGAADDEEMENYAELYDFLPEPADEHVRKYPAE